MKDDIKSRSPRSTTAPLQDLEELLDTLNDVTPMLEMAISIAKRKKLATIPAFDGGATGQVLKSTLTRYAALSLGAVTAGETTKDKSKPGKQRM